MDSPDLKTLLGGGGGHRTTRAVAAAVHRRAAVTMKSLDQDEKDIPMRDPPQTFILLKKSNFSNLREAANHLTDPHLQAILLHSTLLSALRYEAETRTKPAAR